MSPKEGPKVAKWGHIDHLGEESRHQKGVQNPQLSRGCPKCAQLPTFRHMPQNGTVPVIREFHAQSPNPQLSGRYPFIVFFEPFMPRGRHPLLAPFGALHGNLTSGPFMSKMCPNVHFDPELGS